MAMKPEDVKLLLEAIKSAKKKVWNEEERATLRRAKVAAFHGRWLDSRDSWILQSVYRKSQGGKY